MDVQTPELNHRNELGDFLNRLNLVGEGAEIGVCYGENAWQLLKTWQGKKLHLIDPYADQSPEEYHEMNYSWFKMGMEKLWWWAHGHLHEFRDRTEWHRDYSANTVQKFADGSLDFVYIDGNHSFKHTTDDLNHWFPKVKKGGLFAGHDYRDILDDKNQIFSQVKSALDKWASDKGIQFKVTTQGCLSWYFIKQ